MQQIHPVEFISWPGYFLNIKIDEGTKRQRKLQRQPVPVREVAPQLNVYTQYPNHPQNEGCQGQAKKPVCSLVALFGEKQQQSKSQPNKNRSQQNQVIKGDMKSITIQLRYLNAIPVPNLQLIDIQKII